MAETSIASSYPLPRERTLIFAVLLTLAAAGWAILLWQAAMMDDGDMGLTMGFSAPLWVALWIAMMVAIMFPTAAPMITMFARVHTGRRERGQAFVPTWVFAAAYIVLWSLVGVVAYAVAVAGEELADRSVWVMDNAARIGGGVLIAAGLYQLTPLKRACLNKCRNPMGFLMNSWRSGYGGAVRMGVEHGIYCLGCCWLLFAILFPLGIMNVAALALITILIFAEKSTPIGRQAAAVGALVLVAYGMAIMFAPDLLPTMMDDSSSMEMARS